MEGKNSVCIKVCRELVDLLDELGQIESKKLGIEIKGYPNKSKLAYKRIISLGGWKKE